MSLHITQQWQYQQQQDDNSNSVLMPEPQEEAVAMVVDGNTTALEAGEGDEVSAVLLRLD
jgi:hypothetical protein